MLSDPFSTSNVKPKKNYSRLEGLSLSHHLKPCSTEHSKKIIPTQAQQSIREEFKKIFLPLLIDIFELRQILETHKLMKRSPEFKTFGKVSKTPQEIMNQLKTIQEEIEESQKWCEGVILQIAKGIDEAKETLEVLKGCERETQNLKSQQTFSFKSLFSKFRELLCKKK